MKNLRQFMAAPAIALCALITIPSCSNDPEVDYWGAGKPAVSVGGGDAVITRTGVSIPVDVKNAEKIYYAVLAAPAAPVAEEIPEPEIPIPEESDYQVQPAYALQEGKLIIPISAFDTFGTYYVYVYASNPKYKSEPVMTTVEYTDQGFETLLTFEMKNATPYSIDIAVEKSEMCEKYVVTMMREGSYNENSFISSAKSSIAPTQSQLQYGRQSYVVNTESTVLPESRLLKATRYDTDDCQGFLPIRKDETGVILKYVVAAYGVDKSGNDGVYLSEPFELPESPYTAAPTVAITTTTTFTKLNATYKVTGNCTKLVYGSMMAVDPRATPARDEAFWDPSNETKIMAFLKGIATPNLVKYTNKAFSTELPIVAGPGDKVVTFAVGISDDGKLGPISYKVATCKMPNLNGTATITNLTFKEAKNTPYPQLSWNVSYPANTTKLRFLVSDITNYGKYFNGPNIDRDLAWTMSTDESPNGYGWWREVSVAELAAAGNVYSTGDLPFYNKEFVIRVIAQDTFGNWGAIKFGDNQKTLPEEVVDKTIDFSVGTGQITVNIKKMENIPNPDPEKPQYSTSAAIYNITKGANTVAAYIIKIQDNSTFPDFASLTYDKLTTFCQSRMDKETVESWPTVNTVVFGQDYAPESSVFNNPNEYGVSAHVFVTKDNSGNYRIAGVVAAGSAAPIYPAM